MFNIISKIFNKVTQKQVDLIFIKSGEKVSFKTCQEALDYSFNIYAKVPTKETFYDFYMDNCKTRVLFNNSKDILHVSCLDHLKELALG